MKDVTESIKAAGAYIERLRSENQALRDTLASVATLAKIPKGYVVPVHVVSGGRKFARKASRRPAGALAKVDGAKDTAKRPSARTARQVGKPADVAAAAAFLPGQTVKYAQGRGSFEASVTKVDGATGLVSLTRAKDGKALERLASKIAAV